MHLALLGHAQQTQFVGWGTQPKAMSELEVWVFPKPQENTRVQEPPHAKNIHFKKILSKETKIVRDIVTL